MESGQEITVGVWDEMVAQLAEVREKRDRLQVANNRLAQIVDDLRTERDRVGGAVVDSNGQAASLREQLQEMTSQRDAMTRYRDEMRVSRDEARRAVAELQVQLSQWQVGHDAIRESRDKTVSQLESLRAEYLQAKESANANSDQAAKLREQVAEVTAQRDRAKGLCNEWRLEFDRLQAVNADLQGTIEELRAANKQYQSDWVVAKEAADMFEQENTALRDTIRALRTKQVHPDLPGLLLVIQGAAEQARELI